MYKKVKGIEHEENVEFAKELLEEGRGMTEIMLLTGLNEDEIRKYNKEVKSK